MTTRHQIYVLRSRVCQCGAEKDKGLALCGSCWFFLSSDKLRKGLYQRVPAFGAAYEAAVEDLKQVVRRPNGGRGRARGIR